MRGKNGGKIMKTFRKLFIGSLLWIGVFAILNSITMPQKAHALFKSCVTTETKVCDAKGECFVKKTVCTVYPSVGNPYIETTTSTNCEGPTKPCPTDPAAAIFNLNPRYPASSTSIIR